MLDAAHAARHDVPNTTRSRITLPQSRSGMVQLVRWHRCALRLLAMLLIASTVTMQAALNAPAADTAALVQTARQGALAQRVVVGALAVQAAKTPAARTAWEADLRDTAEAWKQLPDGAADGPDKAVMLGAAATLLAALPPDTSRQEIDVSPELTMLLSHQRSYAAATDKALQEDSLAAAAHLMHLRGLQAGFCGLTLLLLGVFALIARPGAGMVGKTLSDLADLEEKKREQDDALGQADRQVARMRETLENLSTIDALTGLQNHRAFHERLDREMGRASRHGQPLSLLLLDVDQFKSYNDRYGHLEGDQALRRIAGLLQDAGRTGDIPARYGGKAFALILPETDMMGAVVLGERLRAAVAAADGFQRPLTTSVGLATLTPSTFSVAALLASADRALCHAKGDGRNRVSHAHHLPAPLEEEEAAGKNSEEYARAA